MNLYRVCVIAGTAGWFVLLAVLGITFVWSDSDVDRLDDDEDSPLPGCRRPVNDRFGR